MKTVLVVGGLGYIGSHTVVALAEAGVRSVIFDNLSNSPEQRIDRLQSICRVEPKFVLGDLREESVLHDLFQDHKIDAVIHFAALKSVNASFAETLDYYDVNVKGTLNLIKQMDFFGIRKLVYSSSAAVYGRPECLPIVEDHPMNPESPYGRTKLISEHILSDVVMNSLDNVGHRWSIVALRYFNPAGAHESGYIGEMLDGEPQNLIPNILRCVFGLADSVQICGDDYDTRDGTGERDFIHITDLAVAHRHALDFVDKKFGFEAINVGTGRSFSVREVIDAFSEAAGISIPATVVPRRQGDVSSCYADVQKARDLLSWRAERGLMDICRSALYFSKKNHAGAADS